MSAGYFVQFLFLWQESQPSTYYFTSFITPSYQKFLVTSFTIFHWPLCSPTGVVRTLSRKRFPQHSNIQPKNLQAHNKVERHNKGISKLSHVTRSGDHKNILEETRDHGTLGYSHCSNSISRAAIQ